MLAMCREPSLPPAVSGIVDRSGSFQCREFLDEMYSRIKCDDSGPIGVNRC